MDLLGDIGHADQLTSTREENKVLQAKVKELTVRVHELKAENEALKAEVEMYREDYRNSSSRSGRFSSSDVGGEYVGESKEALVDDGADHFVTSGDGLYPSDPAVTLPKIHATANPLCCTLNPDDSLLATGGADSNIKLCRWGSALAPGEESSIKAVDDAIEIPCGAPVICCAFARVNQGRGLPVVAAGCMDGSVKLAYCGMGMDAPKEGRKRLLKSELKDGNGIKHGKYVKTICWSPSEPILATASADGTVQLTSASNLDSEAATVSLEVVKSMHFDAAVESMCFVDNGNTLCCYVRGTSYLSYFDLKDDYKQTKMSLNGGSAGTGCFDEHVSFAVLSLIPSPNGEYIAAATDTSRNIIMKTGTEKIVRNLYGHKNDGFSNPKIAWSSSGQYLYGNSQDENCVCVWDIASASIVKNLDESTGGHDGFVRDIYSSCTSDTVASISFDKSAKIWLQAM
eukprot:CAMPEP_0183736320 /NCGR_PEP_ID=MMETSP0737-20130205/49026_1 /TAXON_ID=385413 /ORGANISM="Thalassiosira miniscula, Strain CCMP1093" /LENGTH=456 /DNA_ID=CAMNT_0025970287 /DNA_START=109 /DNA_END=1479 /DNA_ORIENTATION=+